MRELSLDGCSPVPLGSYLKAVGTLRILAAQADPCARGCWRDDVFVVTTDLDREALVDFFLDRYTPTPAVSPWNGGSGFHPKDKFARAALELIDSSGSERLSGYRRTIGAARMSLAAAGADDKGHKERVVGWCRSEFPDSGLPWLDAALLLIEGGLKYPPLLMSGGNDGRLDFSANYMHRLCDVMPELADPRSKGDPRDRSADWLRASLWGERPASLQSASIGYFNPGTVGGANSTSGFGGAALVNPWDFVLMVEGVVLFAAAAARRLAGGEQPPTAAFPFTVRPSPAGVVQGASDRESARAEIWLPLWPRPASSREVEHLCSEGRADWKGRQAGDGLDFVKAIASLGVDRGVGGFVRYGLYQRMGNNHVAAAIGRVRVPDRGRPAVDLVNQIDPWLQGLRWAAGDTAPARLRSAARRLDRAIYQLCLRDGAAAEEAQNVLVELARAERAFASRDSFRPLGLDLAWVNGCYDDSSEFRLATALASIHSAQIGPIRANLEPVAVDRGRLVHRAGAAQVWTGGSVTRDLAAVLRRRLIDADKLAAPKAALESVRFASLRDVEAILDDRLDLARLGELVGGLSMVRWDRLGPAKDAPAPDRAATVPRAYALLKLCCLPFRLDLEGVARDVPIEPAIHAALAAGDVRRAVEAAIVRLRGSGMPLSRALLTRLAASELVAGLAPELLGAALLVPISPGSARRLAELVCLRPDMEENQ
jgi:CRISPR-associated protein Csx17